MDEAERAARRKAKAEHISLVTRQQLTKMLSEFNDMVNAGTAVVEKLKKKKSASARAELDAWLQEENVRLTELTTKYSNRIVSFIREQITSDDGKYL